MILADNLPERHIISSVNIVDSSLSVDEMTKIETKSPNSIDSPQESNSIAPVKIPLVSSVSILATSPKHILASECTKRRNQFLLYNESLEKCAMRSPIRIPLISALWYNKQQIFLLLTISNVFKFDPKTMTIEVINEIIPNENKQFQCFTLINQSTLLIAYATWGIQNLDSWEYNLNSDCWTLIDRQPLKLTNNEFIEDISNNVEVECEEFGLTIYNDLTKEWRMEIRNKDTLVLKKSILLPGSNIGLDYRLVYVKDAGPAVKWLAFSPTNTIIIAIDSMYEKKILNYTSPVQRMAFFGENCLIVRTKERVDIHQYV